MANYHQPDRCLARRTIVGVGAALASVLFTPLSAWGDGALISNTTASAAHAEGHEAKLAVDGNPSTYWESPGMKSMQDYRRFIDIDLHGLYSVSRIDLTLREGHYYHYSLYVSADGENFEKVAFKSNDEKAGKDASKHEFDPVQARYVRVAINFSSQSQAVNVAEAAVYGELVSKEAAPATPIEVKDFEDTEWGKEWNRVATDSDYAAQKTVSEVRNLVGRVLGKQYQDWFVFELREARDGKDVFEISDAGNGCIRVRGNNGISLASGLNYYLRHFCNVDYNPLFGSNLKMPATAPAVGKKLLKYTDYEYRYALNFCTYSYTMAFWDWGEYEPFLDWCAMNGVNLMLDIVGQEEVLRQTLNKYNYSDAEVKEYLTGPAYYAWFYMQNMFSAGGPLPNAWFEQRTELARKIHDRMQAYGIKPVIQGFGGQVPTDFEEKNPKSVAASSGWWSDYARPYMIKTYLTEEDKKNGKEDYFDKVGTTFYETQRRLFGDVSNYYAVDPFHEGGTLPEGFSIVEIYRTVQKKMIDFDEDAVWVMQQWQGGIDEQKLSGLYKKDQALVLDLQSDLRSQASPMENKGVPWVWNMLHNFGGRMGMDGVPEVLAGAIPEAYNNSKYMKGIGITPEAIDNSPIVYELLFDMTWEQDPVDHRAWTREYVKRRYGGTDTKIEQAWDILLETAYKYNPGTYYQGASESIINARPDDKKIGSASTWGHSDIRYDKKEFERAAKLFAESYDTYKDCEAFRYDFVDVMRQVLQNTFQEYQPLAAQAYKNKDLVLFTKLSDRMLKIVDLQDKLLATSDFFLLGTWIDDARTMIEGADDWTADLFELNARALVSTWGQEKNASLVDYSNRQWAGLTGEYYHDRWEIYANNRKTAIEKGAQAADPSWFTYGWEWANRKSDETAPFATKASSDDPKAIASEILAEYTVEAMGEFVGDLELDERTNLAAGKDVMDVTNGQSQKVEGLTDGNADTGWKEPGKREAALEVDLGGLCDISGVGLTLQQTAANFPLSYAIEVLDEKGQWQKVGESTGTSVSSKNDHDCKIRGTKVRYNVKSTDNQNLVGIYEVSVWGASATKDEYTNLSLGAKATASSTEDGKDVNGAIDGDPKSLWVNAGSGASWYKVDLNASRAAGKTVDVVRLVFEESGRQFKFRVIAGLPDGKEEVLLDMANPDKPLEKVYTMQVAKEIQWVKVEFTDATGSAWPAIAELELLQKKGGVESENIARRVKITSSDAKPGEGTAQLVDGKTTGDGDCWVSNNGQKPAWINFDLGKVEDVERMRIKFENDQPDRSMQFKVTAVDATGTTVDVYERGADKLGEQQGLEIDVPVDREVKSLKVDIIDAKVPSNGGPAWPLVAEVEVYARPRNIAPDAKIAAGEGSALTAEQLAKLNDAEKTGEVVLTSDADKAITLDLPKPVDVNALMFGSNMGTTPLTFTVEYVPEGSEGGRFETLIDRKVNTDVDAQLFVRSRKAVLTSRVRVTFTNKDAVKLNELSLYTVDPSAPLRDKLASVRTALGNCTIGEFAGNYTQQSADALGAVIDEAQKALDAGVNSREVAEWNAKLSEALATFFRTGRVTVDRMALNVAIDDARATSAALRSHNQGAAADTLDAAIAEAEKVADAYKMTQAQIDAAAKKLEGSLTGALGQLDAATRLQVTIDAVDTLLKNAVAGEFEGQHPQSAIDALAAARDVAVKAKDAASGDVAKLSEAEKALSAAKETFLGSVVRIDAAAFDAVLAQAEACQKRDYDRDAWVKFAKVFDAAKQVDLAKISQKDLDKQVVALKGALAELEKARLDRSALESAIGRAQLLREGDYTPESWKPFAKALDAAVVAFESDAMTQVELDAAAGALDDAREALVAVDHGAGGGQGGQPGNGGQTGGGQGGSGQGGQSGNPEALPGTGDPASLVGVFGLMAGASVLSGFSWRKRK